ncbi:hypothetical protein TSOC_013738 [Tetrabaena socialis]|uniref:Uncharacterized protein n=1 Tax=Tetrabaena socialis TaxID=47790 RepID=A0A2J7ZJJ6_9CHLO|nr:hypothetical protein TSOC_013738 [Tetrabaena socialis]|eukprot:PNH00439.1 hypothetical protein TSOC_013738 [Tetrabaena socialis]
MTGTEVGGTMPNSVTTMVTYSAGITSYLSSLCVMLSSCTRSLNLCVSQQIMTGLLCACAIMATAAVPARESTGREAGEGLAGGLAPDAQRTLLDGEEALLRLGKRLAEQGQRGRGTSRTPISSVATTESMANSQSPCDPPLPLLLLPLVASWAGRWARVSLRCCARAMAKTLDRLGPRS